MIKWYLEAWWTIMARPIYFYTKLKEEDWKEKSLTFTLISAWILGLAATFAVFIIQYLPISRTLVEGLSGFKFILILPVLLTLALVFFLITLFISGGLLVVIFLALFLGVGGLLHGAYYLLGGHGSLNRMLQSSLFVSSVTLAGLFPIVFAVLTKGNILDFGLFRVGFNLVYYLSLLYAYGLFAVAGRKTYGLSKGKSFLGALAPIIILVIFGLLFDKMVILKLQSWIT